MSSTVEITLALHPAGDHKEAVASPSTFFARPGDTLVFRSEVPFGVDFADASPLAGPLRYRGANTAEQKIRPDGGRDRYYKYTIALADGDRVYIADPRGQVVDDPGRTPNG